MTAGSKEEPWELKTPPGTSAYTMYKDEASDPPALVCQVGSTTLKYHLRAVEDLHAWLKKRGIGLPLGAADEKKPAADGTVEAWGRSPDNPVHGWYGLRKGYRGRFGMYLPAAARGAWPGRGHSRRPQQLHAGALRRELPIPQIA